MNKMNKKIYRITETTTKSSPINMVTEYPIVDNTEAKGTVTGMTEDRAQQGEKSRASVSLNQEYDLLGNSKIKQVFRLDKEPDFEALGSLLYTLP